MKKDFSENNKFFSQSLPKWHVSNGILSEGGKNNRLAGTEGGDLRMDLTSSQKQTIRHQFDSFCKKVLRSEKVDYLRTLSSQMKKEILFSELSQSQIDELRVTDKYPSDLTMFKVQDFEIGVENELLADALKSLPAISRDIVLLSYFMDYTDHEIAEMLNIIRSTVQYRRTTDKHPCQNEKAHGGIEMTKQKELLPFQTIAAASNGDVDAINAILKHYEGYIASLSLRRVYDEDGNGYTIVDEELRRRLETKLIVKILSFEVA